MSAVDPQRTMEVAADTGVALLPNMGAGEGGWCLTTIGTIGCPTVHTPVFEGPIIVEQWSGHSPPPVVEGIVLTTGEVTTVSLEGKAPIPTRAESALPDGLRAAVVELRGASGRRLVGVPTPVAFPRGRFVARNAEGEALPQDSAPGPPLTFEVQSRGWGRATSPPPGVCSIEVRGVAGLVSEGGAVMTTVRPHPDVRGREFVDCVRTSYLLGNWPLEADVLLDAAHPGSTPGPLPAMQPVTGDSRILQGPGVEGETVARRIRGGFNRWMQRFAFGGIVDTRRVLRRVCAS